MQTVRLLSSPWWEECRAPCTGRWLASCTWARRNSRPGCTAAPGKRRFYKLFLFLCSALTWRLSSALAASRTPRARPSAIRACFRTWNFHQLYIQNSNKYAGASRLVAVDLHRHRALSHLLDGSVDVHGPRGHRGGGRNVISLEINSWFHDSH